MRKKTLKSLRHVMKRRPYRKDRVARVVRAAGLVGVTIGGTFATVVNASAPSADRWTASLALTSTDASLQPVIDQILAEEQSAVTADSALSIATPSNNAMLPVGMQNNAFQDLTIVLNQMYNSMNQNPDVVSGDAADNRFYFMYNNPDQYYETEVLSPNASYVITGQVGPGSGDIAASLDQLTPSSIVSGPSLELNNGLVVNSDGTFTIDIGPTNSSDAANYFNDSGQDPFYLLFRDVTKDWALSPGTLNIACVADCPAATPGVTSTGLSSTAISEVLSAVAQQTPANNTRAMELAYEDGMKLPEQNVMTPLETEAQAGISGGLATEPTSLGNFDLQPGQALIIKVPEVDGANYSGIQLMSTFGQTLPYPLSLQNSLNSTQAFSDADGYTYYVVSGTNPGVANWLDSGSLDTGAIMYRMLDVAPGANWQGLPVTTEVVPVADVAQYLPADTPTESPQEFAATMNERVLSYDYTLDSSRTFDSGQWVTDQLWINDLQAAMGTQQYDEVFGAQPSTPMWLRLTPALSPDWSTVVKDVLTNPTASLTAIQNNLSLAEQDISMPVQLAQTLIQQDFTQTAQTVQDDLSSGQFTQALTALATGGQQLSSILNEALFDPNTSITAGILNARDDLATAIMAATNGGFPSQSGLLATLEWDLMPQLTQLGTSTTSADLSTLMSTGVSDLTSLLATDSTAADTSSLLGGLVADLSSLFGV